jgi:hypothetical protein
MNTEALFLFLILLLGLVLCSFLGGNYNKESFTGSFNGMFTVNPEEDKKSNSVTDVTDVTGATNITGVTGTNTNSMNSTKYDNYNHYSGTYSQLTNGATFYGENGGSVKVNMGSDGKPNLLVTLSKGDNPQTFKNHNNDQFNTSTIITITKKKEAFSNFTSNSDNKHFDGPNGETAMVINYQGHQAIKVNTPKGSYIYTINNPNLLSSNQNVSSPFNSNYSTYNNTPSTYFGSTGVNGANVNNSNQAYNISIESSSSPASEPSSLLSPQSLPQSLPKSSSQSSSYDYNDSLPQGIPKSQIPPGHDDLYILKSEIVPPVCPACPSSAACPRQEKCPPCPACARCPEPSFECKKVPNYNSVNSNGNNGNNGSDNNFSHFSNFNSVNNNNGNCANSANSANSSNNNFLPFSNFNSLNNSSNNKFLPVPVLNDFSSFGM